MPSERRKWVPDVEQVADQLIEDYRTASREHQHEDQGSYDTLGTIKAWTDTAKAHDDEWQEDDWVALVHELVQRIVLGARGGGGFAR